MLWRGSGRWRTYQSHQIIHRFLAPISIIHRECFLQAFARAHSSSASASAGILPRPDVSVTALHRTIKAQGDKTKTSLMERESGNVSEVGQQCVQEEQPPALQMPRDLLRWIETAFATSVPRRKLVYLRVCQKPHWKTFLSDRESVCYAAEELARSRTPQRALHVLQMAHSIGIIYKQSVYERVVYRLSGFNKWHLILSVIATASFASVKMTVRLLNWRAWALVNVRDYSALDGILEEFKACDLRTQRRTFLLILQGHLRNHDLARARQTIQKMEDAGFPMSKEMYATVIPAYRGLGLDGFVQDRAHDILANKHQGGGEKKKALNGLLRLYLDNRDLEGALKLLETYGSETNVPEEQHRSKVAVGGARIDGAVGSIGPVEAVDSATYTMIIDYLTKHADRNNSSVNAVLRRLRAVGKPPDMKVAACLVRMYYAHGLAQKALKVLRDCCNPIILQRRYMRLLKKGRDPQDTQESFFGPFTGRPDTELFNSVFQGAIKIRGLEAATPVLLLMKQVRVKPDTQTMEIFLQNLSRDRILLTEELVGIMKQLSSSQIRPSLKSLNIIFESILYNAKAAKYQKGWDALAAFVHESMIPDQSSPPREHSFQHPVQSTDPMLCLTDVQSTMLRDVLKPIISSLRRRGIMADRATFALRMRYDTLTLPVSQAAESSARNLSFMRKRGMHPNMYHYTADMEAHCAAGNVQAAHEVLQKIRRLIPQEKSRVIMYTILISACSRLGRPDHALSYFKEMLSANLVPDSAAIDALVGAFFAAKASRLARRVLLDLWPMVAPFPEEMQNASLSKLIWRLRSIRNQADTTTPVIKTVYRKEELMALVNKYIEEWNKVAQKGVDNQGVIFYQDSNNFGGGDEIVSKQVDIDNIVK